MKCHTIDLADTLPRRNARQVLTAALAESGHRARAFYTPAALLRLWRIRDKYRRQRAACVGEVTAACECTQHAAGKLVTINAPPLPRFIGFLRAAGPRLRKLFRGRPSRTGLTYYPRLDPAIAFRRCPSPQRWERWLAKVRRRAAAILRPWDTAPSWASLGDVIGQWWHRPLPPVGKTAIRLAAATLLRRFGERSLPPREGSWKTWEILAALRVYRGGGTPSRLARPEPAESLDDIGPRSLDDRLTIRDPVVVARCERGVVIADRVLGPSGGDRAAAVQVVVRNPADGTRCHLTVPPWFGLPLWKGESGEARVHAAVAWTFGMSPAEYRPGIES